MNNLKSLTLAFILIFAGLMLFKKGSNSITPAETTVVQLSGVIETRNNRAQLIPSTVEKLRNAYTGQWFKNSEQDYTDQSFNFTKPENTRNQVTAKNNKADDKKKKKTKKKKNTKKKHALRRPFEAMKKDRLVGADFGFNNNNLNSQANGRPYRPQAQNEIDQEDPTLSFDQWLQLLKGGTGFTKLIAKFREGKVSSEIFYTLVDKLMQSETEHKQTGYRLLSATASYLSFEKHITYIEQESTQELQTFAKNELETYKQIGNIGILNQTISTQSANLRLSANLLIRELGESLLAAITNENNPIRSPSSLIMRYKPALQNSLTIISFLLTSGSLDSENTAQLTLTKSVLERLLAEENISSTL